MIHNITFCYLFSTLKRKKDLFYSWLPQNTFTFPWHFTVPVRFQYLIAPCYNKNSLSQAFKTMTLCNTFSQMWEASHIVWGTSRIASKVFYWFPMAYISPINSQIHHDTCSQSPSFRQTLRFHYFPAWHFLTSWRIHSSGASCQRPQTCGACRMCCHLGAPLSLTNEINMHAQI